MLSVITSKDNPKVKQAIKLCKSAALRSEEGVFFASTPKVVTDIISAGFVARELFFMQHEYDRYEKLLDGMDVYIITSDVRDKMSEDGSNQGAFGVFEMGKPDIEKLFSAKKIVILEDVQDPGNLGAIMRTALGFGYENIAVSGKCADIYSSKVLRSSMSASVKLNVYKTEDIPALVEKLNAKGFCTIATCVDGEELLGESEILLPVAIIIGNEGKGISEKTLKLVTNKVKIPMSSRIESLNAAVSASIVMWQMRGK